LRFPKDQGKGIRIEFQMKVFNPTIPKRDFIIKLYTFFIHVNVPS